MVWERNSRAVIMLNRVIEKEQVYQLYMMLYGKEFFCLKFALCSDAVYV